MDEGRHGYDLVSTTFPLSNIHSFPPLPTITAVAEEAEKAIGEICNPIFTVLMLTATRTDL